MTHATIKTLRRRISLTLLAASGILTLVIVREAYILKEWNTIAASFAVLTALITVYISFKTTWKSEDDQEPDLIVKWDFESSNIAYIEIENIGGGTAFDVTMEWKQTLRNAKNEPISVGVIPTIPKIKKLIS